jgi:hypothetical protein
MKLPIDKIAEGDFESEWSADTREFPAEIHLGAPEAQPS